MDSFDYIIVGAGSAGCVLANRLTEDANVTVCLLEAGPRDWHPYIHLPAGFIKTFHMKSINWLYKMEPTEWTGGRSILAPRGKTLGGFLPSLVELREAGSSGRLHTLYVSPLKALTTDVAPNLTVTVA